jgi:cellulose biosynthesis protein BcsQ
MVPTELNVLSFDGVENVMQTIINLQGMHNARVLSVLPVKVRPVGEHRQWLERLRENYPNILWEDVLLSHSVVWEESADAAQTIFTYAPSHKASEQAWALVRKFQRVVGND